MGDIIRVGDRPDPPVQRLRDGPRRQAERQEPAHRCIASDVLMGGCTTLTIRHAGSDYTLRVTRQNKLLLTK
jgi:hemin uptake protein HemP